MLPHPNQFPGGWRISAHVLRIGHPQSLGVGTNAVDVGWGGVLELANGIALRET